MDDLQEFDDVIDDLLQDEERWAETKALCWDGLSYGFPSVDKMTGGLHPGEVVVIGARTGHGKSSMGNQISFQVAKQLLDQTEESGEDAGTVLMFTPEMRPKQVFERQASVISGVRSWDVKTGKADEIQRLEWRGALDALRPLAPHLTVVAGENVFLEDMQAALAAEGGRVKLLVVDYVQRILTKKSSSNAWDRVSTVSRDLKDIANRYGCTILVMAQLSRELEKDAKDGKPRLPRLSDISDSSGIEKDADLVMLIHRYQDPDEEPRSRSRELAKLLIAKQRSGPQGTVELYYNPALTYFEDPRW